MTKRQIVMLSAILAFSILFGVTVSADFLISDDIPECPAVEDHLFYEESPPDYGVYDIDDLPYMKFSVTVPAYLPIAVSETGVVTTAANAQIINNSAGKVMVTDIWVSGENGWSVVPYNRNMASEKVDSRQIGLKINNAETGAGIDGTTVLELTESEWIIPRESSFPLYYEAVVSANSLPVVGLQVMTLYFVVGWA